MEHYAGRLAVSSDGMVWRLCADHGRKQETGGDDDGKASQAPRSLRRYDGRPRAARPRFEKLIRGT